MRLLHRQKKGGTESGRMREGELSKNSRMHFQTRNAAATQGADVLAIIQGVLMITQGVRMPTALPLRRIAVSVGSTITSRASGKLSR